ncbi:unnamed protein product [Meloidogyne enterolobii]|uniref:Uncharacterized protein n=1 Tax=Meloidogyne enterolobii TaxID=390850 RepID=A0ACB0ZA43_MELEN
MKILLLSMVGVKRIAKKLSRNWEWNMKKLGNRKQRNVDFVAADFSKLSEVIY